MRRIAVAFLCAAAPLLLLAQEEEKRPRGAHPKRFVAFANVDFRGIDAPNFGANAAHQLEQD